MLFNIYGNADPSDIYKIVSSDSFFRELSTDGVTVSSSERLSAVSAAHRVYTNSIASLPVMIRKKSGDERSSPRHYLNYTLKIRANDYMTPFMVKKIIASQAFWYGVGYAAILRDGSGRVKEIIPLPSYGHQRYVDHETGTIWHAFSVSDDTPEKNKLTRKFTESELLIHMFESYDGVRGRGILDLAKDSISTDSCAQKYSEKFYRNGARISGIVEVPGDVDEPARDIIRSDFEKMASGINNAFRVAVLDNGMKYTQLGCNQRDAQFIESRTFSVIEISRFTGIPAYMLQEGKQSYNSNEQQQLDFVINTLVPPICQMEEEWAYKLYRRAELDDGMYIRFNVASLLRGDNKTRSEFYEKMIGMGIYNPDDCRALEEMSPLPNGEGKKHWMSKNYDTISNIIKGASTQGGGN